MAEYDTTDEADVNPKMEFRLEFNHEDPELWFATLERNMLTRGIKSQLSKEAVLVANLPAKVQTVCRSLLTARHSATPYKDMKTRILQHFGPKDTEMLAKAESLRLEGKPSELALKLLQTLQCCDDKPTCKLQTMAKGYWLRQLPGTVAALFADAEFKINNRESLDKLLQRADESYAQFTMATESRDVTPAVTEITKEVDALNVRPKQQKPAKKDKGAQDTKPKKLVNGMCYIHAKYGVQATKCALPEKCLHRNQIAPKSDKSQ